MVRTPRPPSPEEIKEIAREYYFELSNEEAESFASLVTSRLRAYKKLDELPEPQPGLKRTDRREGYRPGSGEDPLNAFVTKCTVPPTASGRLSGYEVGIKDNIAVAGIEMTCGSRLLDDYVPSIDATVATRLLEEGATITGKLNMDDMAFAGSGETALGGPVRNPRDTDYLAGGSSSGAAAAVGSGDVDVAIGTDQAGSVRIPAAWCGCVGLKPTYGLVPYTGIVSLGRSEDHVGVITGTVRECALVLDAVAGTDRFDPRQCSVSTSDYVGHLSTDVDDVEIGVLEEGFAVDGGLEGNVVASVRTALERFQEVVEAIENVSAPLHRHGERIAGAVGAEEAAALIDDEGIGNYARSFYDTRFAEAFARARREHATELPATVKFGAILGSYVSERCRRHYYSKAQNLGFELGEAYDAALSEVDVLALPTTVRTAHPVQSPVAREKLLERSANMFGNTYPFNLTGHPAVSIPCGTVDGLPVGMMLVGDKFDEGTVLRVAHAFERTEEE